jgi:peptidyl-dipeptidase A
MKLFSFLVLVAFAAIAMVSCNKTEVKEGTDEVNMEEVKKMEAEFKTFSEGLQNTIKVKYKAVALGYFNSAVSGKEEDYAITETAEKAFNAIVSNKDDFKKLKEYKESGLIQDPILVRVLDMLYNEYLGKQLDEEMLNKMTEMSTNIEKKYSKFRAKVGNKELSDNEIEDILKSSTDSKELQAAWEGHKAIGPVVAADVIALVKLRNEAAKKLGFNNYHEMSLKLGDQDPAEVEALFDELDELTKGTFADLKTQIDEFLSARLKIKKEELMPWHFQNRFFQEAPQIYSVDLDKYYKGKDLVKLTEDYFASIDQPIDDLVKNSDLFEKPGKMQHAFCTDIDRDTRDVRVLCNVRDNYMWMNTMLHEYGHAVYFKYHDQSMPWILKTPAHTFTTEAIAMLFGRFASNPQWMVDNLGIDPKEAVEIQEIAFNILKLEQLTFSRWSQVMFRFEKSMYENPDQDLNKLWWDLVEKYQMVKKPEGRNQPDWASKIHIATSPCYYHNYHLGELLASQVDNYIKINILKLKEGEITSYYGNKEVGAYLIDKIYAPGAKYSWNDMIEKATGEKLTPKYYAQQFVK